MAMQLSTSVAGNVSYLENIVQKSSKGNLWCAICVYDYYHLAIEMPTLTANRALVKIARPNE